MYILRPFVYSMITVHGYVCQVCYFVRLCKNLSLLSEPGLSGLLDFQDCWVVMLLIRVQTISILYRGIRPTLQKRVILLGYLTYVP